MTIHGAIMVIAGLAFGYAVIRARVLPRWTATALMTGVVFVAISQGLPEGPGAGRRDSRPRIRRHGPCIAASWGGFGPAHGERP
jgi:hypothetical protein